MPLKLNVGVSRKLGLPRYCSAGASCNIEVELDSNLLQNDPDGFQAHIRRAFIAARQAVDDELVRLQSKPAPPADPAAMANGHTHGPPVPVNGSSSQTNGVPAQTDGVPAQTNGLPARPNGVPARTNGVPSQTNATIDQAPRAATPSQVRAIYAIAYKKHADLEELLRDEYGVDRPEELSHSEASAVIARLQTARSE